MKTKKSIDFKFPIIVTKSYSVKAEGDEEDKWYLEGYAATSDFDLQGDIITPEALRKAEKDLLENSTVLYNHHLDEPIGKVLESKWTKDGLRLKIMISKTVPDKWEQIKEGVLNKFSITAKVLDISREFVADLNKVANIIKELTLVEASLVSVPANSKARAIGWYVGKALKEYEDNGGDMSEFETVVQTEEMELSLSKDASEALQNASPNDNTVTDADELGDEKYTTPEEEVVGDDKESKEEKQKKLAETLEKNEITKEKAIPKVETDKVKTQKTVKSEKKTAKKVKKSLDSPDKTVHNTDKNVNGKPKTQESATKVKKKNFDSVKMMLMDIFDYLDSPNADKAIPESVKEFIGKALGELNPAEVEKKATIAKSTDAEKDVLIQELQKKVSTLEKEIPAKRKGIVSKSFDNPSASEDTTREDLSQGTPEERLRKALELGVI